MLLLGIFGSGDRKASQKKQQQQHLNQPSTTTSTHSLATLTINSDPETTRNKTTNITTIKMLTKTTTWEEMSSPERPRRGSLFDTIFKRIEDGTVMYEEDVDDDLEDWGIDESGPTPYAAVVLPAAPKRAHIVGKEKDLKNVAFQPVVKDDYPTFDYKSLTNLLWHHILGNKRGMDLTL